MWQKTEPNICLTIQHLYQSEWMIFDTFFFQKAQISKQFVQFSSRPILSINWWAFFFFIYQKWKFSLINCSSSMSLLNELCWRCFFFSSSFAFSLPKFQSIERSSKIAHVQCDELNLFHRCRTGCAMSSNPKFDDSMFSSYANHLTSTWQSMFETITIHSMRAMIINFTIERENGAEWSRFYFSKWFADSLIESNDVYYNRNVCKLISI